VHKELEKGVFLVLAANGGASQNWRKRMVYLAMDGEHVRSLREQKAMSQRELAGASGVSKKMLANAELGKTYAFPETARKIGAALDVDPRSLARVVPRA
jgi:DNA-binding XRE family transcriptional regulator